MQILMTGRQFRDMIASCTFFTDIREVGSILAETPEIVDLVHRFRKPTPQAVRTVSDAAKRIATDVIKLGEMIAMQVPDDDDEILDNDEATQLFDVDETLARRSIDPLSILVRQHREHVPDCDNDVCFTTGTAEVIDMFRMVIESNIDEEISTKREPTDG